MAVLNLFISSSLLRFSNKPYLNRDRVKLALYGQCSQFPLNSCVPNFVPQGKSQFVADLLIVVPVELLIMEAQLLLWPQTNNI